jgi:hypothetical protein
LFGQKRRLRALDSSEALQAQQLAQRRAPAWVSGQLTEQELQPEPKAPLAVGLREHSAEELRQEADSWPAFGLRAEIPAPQPARAATKLCCSLSQTFYPFAQIHGPGRVLKTS